MGAETEAELMRQMTDMRRRGMTDEQILQTLAMQELEGTGIDVPSDVPEVLPRAGEEAWGAWSQSETTINLELCVDANTAAKSVCCEVNSGKLEVRVGESATLVGALTQQVYGEPDWTLDIRPDGQRVLCVELEKRKAAPDALAAQALFTSLQVDGVEVGAPGLVAGVYLEERRLGASIEAQDDHYGIFDGSVPDMRGGVADGPLPLL